MMISRPSRTRGCLCCPSMMKNDKIGFFIQDPVHPLWGVYLNTLLIDWLRFFWDIDIFTPNFSHVIYEPLGAWPVNVGPTGLSLPFLSPFESNKGVIRDFEFRGWWVSGWFKMTFELPMGVISKLKYSIAVRASGLSFGLNYPLAMVYNMFQPLSSKPSSSLVSLSYTTLVGLVTSINLKLTFSAINSQWWINMSHFWVCWSAGNAEHGDMAHMDLALEKSWTRTAGRIWSLS